MRDERKEELLAWKQQRAAAAAVASPTSRSDTQRRRSLQSSALSPQRSAEAKPSVTATYTQQFLRKRRSQQNLADANVPSPSANGNHRSIEDAANGPPLDTMENGHQSVELVAPPPKPATVEIQPPQAREASSGKGVAVRSGGHSLGAINQVENIVPVNYAMTKKRGRSAVVLAVAAGVVTLSVAGGVAVCRLYPSSPAAVSIRMAANRAEEVLYAWLVQLGVMVKPYAEDLSDAMRAKLFALLESGRLNKAARAGAALANEEFHVYSELVKLSALLLALMEDTRTLAISGLIDGLKLVAGSIQPRLKAVLELMGLDLGELVDRVGLLLLTTLLFAGEVLKEFATWARSSMDGVFEWTGLESDVSDAELPSDEFLEPLLAQQTALQNIGRGLTARESQALYDVKQSEKRRVAIASASNSIISDTRAILDSILDVKFIAMELVEGRIERLADQYAASIEQELKEYEHTTRQVEEEGGPGVVTEVVPEGQPQVAAAGSLKQELALLRKITAEEPSDAHDNAEQDVSGAKLPHEELLPVDLSEAPVSEEQGPSHDVLLDTDNNVEEAPSTGEVAEETLPSAEPAEIAATEHSFSDEIFARESVSDEQLDETAEPNGIDSPIGEPFETRAAENSLDDDHAIEYQTQIVAAVAEELLEEIDLATSDKETAVHGELKQTVVTEVLVELGDIVLELEHTQVDVTNLFEPGNTSAADNFEPKVLHHQEEQTVAHLTVPVDGTEMELVVELDNIAPDTMDNAGMEQIQPDVSTRIAILSGTDALEEDQIEKNNMLESVQEIAHPRVDKELMASDSTVEVYEEPLDSEAVRKVDVAVVEVEVIVADLELIETELVSLHSDDDTAAESETQTVSAQQEAINLVTEEGVRLVTPNEADMETEIHELVQLEQVLLQEAERVREEEELHVIAEEEEIKLQKEVHSTAGQASSRIFVHEDRIAEPMHASAAEQVDVESGGGRSSLGFPLPRSALMNAALLSTAFLSLAILAVYLLARYRKKRVLYARAVRKRKRWHRLAEMDDSDIEEVVLLQDDSSDDDEDDGKAEKRSLEVVKPNLGVNVAAEVVQKISEDHEDVDEETEEFPEEEDVVQSDSESPKSRTVVIERVQSLAYTVDHPVTPKSNASADDSDSASVSTPPYNPMQEPQDTPDTTERARRRLRREMRT